MKIVETYEHSTVWSGEQNLLDQHEDLLCKLFKIKISYDQEKKEKQKQANYIIGVYWLKEGESIIKIKPKKKNIDFFTILDEILKHPKVNKHLDSCYTIYDDKPKIKVEKQYKEIINIFLLLHFLRLVKKITEKGLKKGYIRITENLTSKIKGKILVNKTVKNNHFKSRQDKTYCNYQIFSTNCIENQLIISTLESISPIIYSLHNKNMANLMNQIKPYFRTVNRIHLSAQTFKNIKHTNFFIEYKKVIKLAEQIYKNITQSIETTDTNSFIFPFIINMPELFERYCEVKLRERYSDLLAGYGKEGYSETKTRDWKLRPDFLLPSKNMIIDSKYKFWYKNRSNAENIKTDFQQLSLYARHIEILKKIKIQPKNNIIPSLVFIYPNIEINDRDEANEIDGKEHIDLDRLNEEKNFEKIYKISLKIPINQSNS